MADFSYEFKQKLNYFLEIGILQKSDDLKKRNGF